MTTAAHERADRSTFMAAVSLIKSRRRECLPYMASARDIRQDDSR